MVLLIEFTADSPQAVAQKVRLMHDALKPFGHEALFEEDETEAKAKKVWIMRRESFNLLRKKVHDKHTAPFIDDIIVRPDQMPEFLPKLEAILEPYHLIYSIVGHVGSGNFHIIPLMDLRDYKTKSIIAKVVLSRFRVGNKMADHAFPHRPGNSCFHLQGAFGIVLRLHVKNFFIRFHHRAALASARTRHDRRRSPQVCDLDGRRVAACACTSTGPGRASRIAGRAARAGGHAFPKLTGQRRETPRDSAASRAGCLRRHSIEPSAKPFGDFP
jgi:hypothetical protein